MKNQRAGMAGAGVAIALLCGGCGGGGDGTAGGSTPPPSTTPPNRAPIVVALTISGTEDQAIAARVTATDADNDALTFTKATDPAHGALTAFAGDGNFTYAPVADFFGTDTFTVTARDVAGNTATGTVTVNVANVNDAPRAVDDFIEIAPAATLKLDVLANDVDIDGETPTVSVLETFPVGNATVADDGSIALTSPPDFVGTLGVRYRVKDAAGLSSDATAVAFVGIPGYRLLFGATERSGARGFWMHDLASWRRLGTFPAGAMPERHVITSADGSVLAYQRGDGFNIAEYQAQNHLYLQRTGAGSPEIELAPPPGLEFTPGLLFLDSLNFTVPISLSSDGRWLVAVLRPAGVTGSSGDAYLYRYDTQAPSNPVRLLTHHDAARQQAFLPGTHRLVTLAWHGAGPGNELVEVDVDAPSTEVVLSESHAAGILHMNWVPSPDLTRIMTLGNLADVMRIGVIDLGQPGHEAVISDGAGLGVGEQYRGLQVSNDGTFKYAVLGTFKPGSPGTSYVRRFAIAGNEAPVTVSWSTDPALSTILGAVNPQGGILIRKTPGGTSALNAVTLSEVDFESATWERPVSGTPYSTATFALGGKRILLQGASPTGPRLLAHDDLATLPLALSPAYNATIAVDYRFHFLATRGGDEHTYLVNAAAADTWYLPAATQPDLTATYLVGALRRTP